MTRRTLCGAALCLSLAGPARADVLEVRSGGTVAVLASDRGAFANAATVASEPPEPAPDVPAAALTTFAAPTAPAAFQASLNAAAQDAGVSPRLLEALVWQESRWHPGAVSPKGARGLTQLMPGTARALAVDPTDVAANLRGGARYLSAMLKKFDGNVERALAAYNAGPARVLRSPGIPDIAETRAYVAAIFNRLDSSQVSVSQGENP